MKKPILMIAIAGFLVAACGGGTKKPDKPVIFDVPALFGTHPEELDGKVGVTAEVYTPTKAERREGIRAERTYGKGGYTLNVEYEHGTATIYNFFVSADSGPVDNDGLAELKQIAGVWDKPANIHVDPVRALGKTGSYTGITITRY